MEQIKRIIKSVFSTEFLMKLLIIAGVIALLKISDGGFFIRIDHYHNSGYGGFDVNLKETERPR